MDNYGAGSLGAFVIAMIGVIYGAINHKKSRCNLCGRVFSASVDVDPSTPENKSKVDETHINQEKHESGQKMDGSL